MVQCNAPTFGRPVVPLSSEQGNCFACKRGKGEGELSDSIMFFMYLPANSALKTRRQSTKEKHPEIYTQEEGSTEGIIQKWTLNPFCLDTRRTNTMELRLILGQT